MWATGRSRQRRRTTMRSKGECGTTTAYRGRWCQGKNECSALSACIVIGAFQGSHWRGLRAMIGMTGQNGRGPIILFQKQDANHLVRPGRAAERNAEFCFAPQIGRKSVRAADHENSVGDRIVPPAAEMPGKSGAVDVVTALVQRHQDGFRRYCGRNRGGFLGHPGRGVAGAALGDFLDIEAAKAEFAANVVESLAIAVREFPLRTLLQPAD